MYTASAHKMDHLTNMTSQISLVFKTVTYLDKIVVLPLLTIIATPTEEFGPLLVRICISLLRLP